MKVTEITKQPKKNDFHKPVLTKEVMKFLNVVPQGTYVDLTLGGGGHSYEVYQKLSKGILVSIDRDSEAIEFVQKHFGDKSKNWILVQDEYSNLKKILEKLKILSIDGILADLGASSHQLDSADRGFTYQKKARLDMRMDKSSEVSAYELINGLYANELEAVFSKYGEERYAKQIAKAIVEYRKTKKIESTLELVSIVRKAVPVSYREGSKHPAKRIFQALRIAVNNEVEELRQVLGTAFSVLKPTGIGVFVSFHSLEHGSIEGFINRQVDNGKAINLTRVPVKPQANEILINPRSRSAELRAFQKIKN